MYCFPLPTAAAIHNGVVWCQFDGAMGYQQIPTSLVLPVQKNMYSSGSSVAPAPISAHGLKEAATYKNHLMYGMSQIFGSLILTSDENYQNHPIGTIHIETITKRIFPLVM